MHNKERYYNANTGQFSIKDLIKDGFNWYAYCGNNPLNYADPSGKRRAEGYNSKCLYRR